MKKVLAGVSLVISLNLGYAQNPKVQYGIAVKDANKHLFAVEMNYMNTSLKDSVDFYLPRWTPGYYQMMDFAQRISDLSFQDGSGNALGYVAVDSSHWKVAVAPGTTVRATYAMLEDKNFVAESYVDSNRAYILPTNVFLYNKDIQYGKGIVLKVSKYPKWPSVYGTGLDLVGSDDDSWTFHAQTLDDFYDSPILMGKLDSLHSFDIGGMPHSFIGYQLGRNAYTEKLMDDMKKIISQSLEMFQDIPYKKYVFLGIGPGQGGIEHLNSSSVSFTGEALKHRNGYLRTLSFLTHEYFHNFNVKRIRPIELGPFDYQKENRTRQLWISEGLSVYYEHWLLYKTGFYSKQEFLNTFGHEMDIYENKPGHLIQSLVSSSWNTWSDGPFGNLSDTAISYYDKGPVVGLLFDCAIKYYSKGKYTLENVMKALYDRYYKKLGRGFTENEFQTIVVKYGTKEVLPLFDYINTAKEVDYNKYLRMQGLKLISTKSNGNLKFTIELIKQ